MEKTEMMKSCGQMCGDNRFELIDKIKEDVIRATNITKEETELLGNILFRLWQRHWLRDSNKIDELQAKAAAYDRLMSGGKKTLKEWSNWLGMNIAVKEDGIGVVSKNPLEFSKLGKGYKTAGYWTIRVGYCYSMFYIPSELIDFTGDWKDSLTLPDSWEVEK